VLLRCRFEACELMDGSAPIERALQRAGGPSQSRLDPAGSTPLLSAGHDVHMEEEKHWEGCPFHESGECPQEAVVDRLLLVPQFLSTRECEAARATCQSCEKRLAERRKHHRTRRFLTGVLFKERGAPYQAKILDVSEGGALLELDGWVHFEQDEKATLEIHSAPVSPAESSRPPQSRSLVE